MLNILEYQYIDSYTYMLSACSHDSFKSNPVLNWLMYGKLRENVVVKPTDKVQVVTPSARNRVLGTVTVEATA